MEQYDENEFKLDVITEMVHIADDIRSIKRWVTFFGVLFLISLISGLLIYLYIFFELKKSFVGF